MSRWCSSYRCSTIDTSAVRHQWCFEIIGSTFLNGSATPDDFVLNDQKKNYPYKKKVGDQIREQKTSSTTTIDPYPTIACHYDPLSSHK